MKLKFTISLCILCFAMMAQWTDISTGKVGKTNLVWAVSEDSIVATGNNGKMYFSHDGGQSFDSIVTIFNFAEWFSDLHFTSSGKGYFCGGSAFGNYTNFLASTDDVGLSWDSLTSNQFVGSSFNQIDFLSDNIGLISGENGLLLKTLDAGQSFTPIPIPPGTRLNSIALVDSQTCFISTTEVDLTGFSNYKIFKSIDQGDNWREVYLNSIMGNSFTNYKHINNFHFSSPMIGHAVGNNGLVLKTIDGGENWTSKTLVNDSTFFLDVYFINENLGFTLGIYAFASNSRTTWTTNDGGENWTKGSYSFSSISFANDSLGYAIENGVLFKTSQAGSIGQNENEISPFTLFPNPISSGEFLHLANLGDSKTIEIYDALGRVMMKKNYEGAFQLTNFQAGIYFIKIEGSSTQIAPFIVVE